VALPGSGPRRLPLGARTGGCSPPERPRDGGADRLPARRGGSRQALTQILRAGRRTVARAGHMLGRERDSETEANVGGSWAGSMQAALRASLGRPQWWVMALAAFLVRGGIVVVLLPLVPLPSVSELSTALAPTVEAIAMSRQSLEATLYGTAMVGAVAAVLL